MRSSSRRLNGRVRSSTAAPPCEYGGSPASSAGRLETILDSFPTSIGLEVEPRTGRPAATPPGRCHYSTDVTRSSPAPPTGSAGRSPIGSGPRARACRASTSRRARRCRFDLADTDGIAGLVDRIEADRGPGRRARAPSPASSSRCLRCRDDARPSYRRVLPSTSTRRSCSSARCGRGMAERGYGRILSITSIHGQRRRGAVALLRHLQGRARRRRPARSRSSSGLHGILVNALAPGFVNTRMSVVDGAERARVGLVPRRSTSSTASCRCGAPRSPRRSRRTRHGSAPSENTYLTGQVITVDGGLSVTF